GVGAAQAARRGAADRAHGPGDGAAARVRTPVHGGPLGPARGDDALAERGRDIVDHLSPDSEIGLVLASEGSSAPVAELSSDRPRVSAALAAVSPSAR